MVSFATFQILMAKNLRAHATEVVRTYCWIRRNIRKMSHVDVVLIYL